MSHNKRSYAVVGKPVAHSLSPAIHKMFASELGLDVEYGLLEPQGDDFEGAAREFFASGGKGLNVTLPYKSRALAFADRSSAFANKANSANTLKVGEDGTIDSCTTDGAGFVLDVTRRHGFDLRGSSVLVLGAGGSASSIVHSLVTRSPSLLRIANRTHGRADELATCLAEEGRAHGVRVTATALDRLDGAGGHDLVIHTTSAGHGNDRLGFGPEVLNGASLAYDLSYGKAARPFLDLARSANVKACVDGLGMLVEQAALSFAYWEGAMPSTDNAYKALAA